MNHNRQFAISILSGILVLFFSCKQETKPPVDTSTDSQAAVVEASNSLTYAVTIDGKKLSEIPEPDSVLLKNKEKLDAARMYYLGHLSQVNSYLGYAVQSLESGMVENAINVLTKGIEQFQNSADLYLLRGKAFVQGRQFPAAISDFWKAGKALEGQKDVKSLIEKTEMDKKINENLQYEIYKWMGLAFQSQADFLNAEKMYEVCGDFSNNSDLYCMAYYWQYQCYFRANRQKDGQQILESVDPKMFIMPVTKPYLDALLYYKGTIKESDLVNLDVLPKSSPEARDWTIRAYAIAVKAVYDNNQEKQLKVLEKIIASPYWNQMPYIAAEADLHLLKGFQYKEMESKEVNSKKIMKPK